MKATRTYTMAARADGVAATRERIARAAAGAVPRARLRGRHPRRHRHGGRRVPPDRAQPLRVEGGGRARRGRAARRRDDAPPGTTPEPGDVPGAVRALVGDYERHGRRQRPLGRVRAPRDPRRRCSTRPGRSHQDWIVAMFGDRLPTAPAARRRAVHALHAATDVYTWKLLRRDLHLSPNRDREDHRRPRGRRPGRNHR